MSEFGTNVTKTTKPSFALIVYFHYFDTNLGYVFFLVQNLKNKKKDKKLKLVLHSLDPKKELQRSLHNLNTHGERKFVRVMETCL